MNNYRLFVCDVNPDGTNDVENHWTEDYYLTSPEDAKNMINRFNLTLRPGEKRRALLEVAVLEVAEDGQAKLPHNWEKVNNFTNIKGKASYDVYRCTRCRITGKRKGLSASVIRDAQYKYKKYEYCKGDDDGSA